MMPVCGWLQLSRVEDGQRAAGRIFKYKGWGGGWYGFVPPLNGLAIGSQWGGWKPASQLAGGCTAGHL